MPLPALHSLLLQTPISQLSSVLADIRGLLSPANAQVTGVNPTLAKDFEASLPQLLQRFYEEQGKVVRLPGMEGGSIVAKEAREAGSGEKDSNTYRDEGKAKRFEVDTLAGTAVSTDPYTVRSKDEFRIELDRALQGYLREHYPDLDKNRPGEGACGAVWRGPLREVTVVEPERGEEQSSAAAAADEDGATQPALEEEEEQQNAPISDQAGVDVPSSSDLSAEGKEEPAAASGGIEAAPTERPAAADEGEDGELVESEVGEAKNYTIRIVSGKSNASNFWSGRLISTYVYDVASSTLTGSLTLEIHYYENGNVQLKTSTSSTSLNLPASFANHTSAHDQAKAIVQTIKKFETEYQLGIEETYEGLNEKAFKKLRRQLPVTRQKIDWDKVLNYRLGSDLAGAQQAR